MLCPVYDCTNRPRTSHATMVKSALALHTSCVLRHTPLSAPYSHHQDYSTANERKPFVGGSGLNFGGAGCVDIRGVLLKHVFP